MLTQKVAGVYDDGIRGPVFFPQQPGRPEEPTGMNKPGSSLAGAEGDFVCW